MSSADICNQLWREVYRLCVILSHRARCCRDSHMVTAPLQTNQMYINFVSFCSSSESKLRQTTAIATNRSKLCALSHKWRYLNVFGVASQSVCFTLTRARATQIAARSSVAACLLYPQQPVVFIFTRT